ncbi:hypothetical protein [Phycisphaera mikurensis]|uniref:Penicillin-binding protein activator LpoB n=1 Tax=Phycisphaera mikurensis (strain NBRC 102666 / KCTC 22515 / FYK2301M01) TaxID=1142394 RepID=I0IHA1_PHYMF|nr:hypothetical protein [Phycisphaera mikurensis]MBB6440888.1 hypothetical protein [Phycisphaera mikurensis]BAM04639.1 hypothetical protein PSMK_24800 [Phycisphaera mikurensis NBRC 102666]
MRRFPLPSPRTVGLGRDPAPRSAAVCAIAAALLVASCGPASQRIDPRGDRQVQGETATFAQFSDAASEMLGKMLRSDFLDREAYRPHPVRMVVSDIENKTDTLPPTELMLSRIREGLLNSGKVVYVSTLGSDGTDRFTTEAPGQLLDGRPNFRDDTLPEAGQFEAPRLSLRTQVLWYAQVGNQARQSTYVVRMFVSDVQRGVTIWESTSDPIAIRTERGRGVGL